MFTYLNVNFFSLPALINNNKVQGKFCLCRRAKLRLFIFILTVIFSHSVFALENRLKNHASPYLAMHGDDPVLWQEWNDKAVKQARQEGKLLFVSSGYFSCHWCHVMQQESYKNKDVAQILNTHFIPVKVDREINSALDSRLIEFVERTQGHAGWPLNVFVTPDGYPLVGMTYVPTNNFITILNNLKIKWEKEKPLLQSIAKQATDELASGDLHRSDKIKKGLGRDYLNRFLLQATAMADDMAGGFGEQNKFPSYPQLNVMLKAYKNKPDKELKEFLFLTLNKMASQGLYDQLAGGFFRYSVDPNWQVPHFEKMLYDNALLASLYIEAAKIFKNNHFSTIAKNTLDFMLTVFRSRQGAYIASLSAVDNKGVEGGYYLWQADELKGALTKNEMQLVELIWQLQGTDDLEGGHHLVEVMNINEAAKMLKMPLKKARSLLQSAKEKMLQIQQKRNVPRDDKLLAGWNGLALSAFSKAAKYFNEPRYKTAAVEIKKYIYGNLWRENSLIRAVKNNKALGVAGLEDYAYVAQGLYDWLDYAENEEDKKWLQKIIDQSWKRFHGQKGWLLAENMLLKYGQGEAVIADGVLPSASAILINVSLKISEKTNNSPLTKKSLEALNVGNLDIVSQPFWYASHILTLFEYQQTH